MIALLQRVRKANVSVSDQIVGEIEHGILALVAVEPQDQITIADRLLDKILQYRMFQDHEDKMNLNVTQVNGSLLLVSQFTLAADTSKGLRPGFSTAASPALAKELFNYFVSQAQLKHPKVATGQFGAEMQVSLVNDGPVTFWLKQN